SWLTGLLLLILRQQRFSVAITLGICEQDRNVRLRSDRVLRPCRFNARMTRRRTAPKATEVLNSSTFCCGALVRYWHKAAVRGRVWRSGGGQSPLPRALHRGGG